jgi:hypothetical protein
VQQRSQPGKSNFAGTAPWLTVGMFRERECKKIRKDLRLLSFNDVLFWRKKRKENETNLKENQETKEMQTHLGLLSRSKMRF